MYKLIMQKILILLLLPLLIGGTSKITKPEISGIIYDKETHEELCGVRVISDTDTTYTDFDGHFKLPNNNITKIKFELISYEKKDTIISKPNQLIIKL